MARNSDALGTLLVLAAGIFIGVLLASDRDRSVETTFVSSDQGAIGFKLTSKPIKALPQRICLRPESAKSM